MPIKIGTQKYTKIYIGSTAYIKAYLGSTLVMDEVALDAPNIISVIHNSFEQRFDVEVSRVTGAGFYQLYYYYTDEQEQPSEVEVINNMYLIDTAGQPASGNVEMRNSEAQAEAPDVGFHCHVARAGTSTETGPYSNVHYNEVENGGGDT